ncbi:TRAP-type C4-dicarboxylate transport system permease small subunit [Roseinatronobacter thiooxidans]|uniref:TRAP transporter small permease protein n=1 Tax=Roseinatronobacter thiooxidans TaxID=121821 RepID=A0A2W7PXW2_9RHOB|nr:TRAP transporter small permease [Roseinatronobacter thiooxidans]PZX36757.1 TRAP-type C4-dicarboxylate transport system permease small subunit [Roseinatronobacter thiooxidans]
MVVRIANWMLRGIDATVDFICATSLLAVTAVVFFNAMGRYLFSFALVGAEELARLLTVYLCFFGAYVLLRRDGHVSVDIITLVVPAGLLRLLRGVVGMVAGVTMLYLAWYSWQLVGFSMRTGQQASTLPVPRYVFFLPVAVSASLMVVASVDKVVRAITNTLPPLPGWTDETVAADADKGKAR